MSEHTPGPYKRFKDGSMIVSGDPRTGVIATVHRNAGPGAEPAQFEANAELFAAAPETAAERDRLRGENQLLREFIADLNNTARHKWAAAVEEATDKLFKEMSANPVFKEARALATTAKPKEPADHE